MKHLTDVFSVPIWASGRGKRPAGRTPNLAESFFKKFSKKLLTVEKLGHIWLFTDETAPSGMARLRFIHWIIRCPGKTGKVKRGSLTLLV